jgi:virginiamycin B lyase
MRAPRSTNERQNGLPPPSRSGAIGSECIRAIALLLAALLVLTLALVPRAEAFVYWAHSFGGAIGRANLDGTGVDQSFITGTGQSWGVAVDDAHVYWSNTTGTIGRANLDGTRVDQSFISTLTTGFTWGVAVDAEHVYWANNPVVEPELGTIGRANLDGTGVDPSFITGTDNHTFGVAVDADHVYWGNYDTGTIGRANLDGTGVDNSFIAADDAIGMAVDADHVYWANNDVDLELGTIIGRANLDGTGVDQSFITGPDDGIGVAVDADHVYWSNVNNGTIGRANLDGTGVDNKFIAAREAVGVAVDALRSFSFGKAMRNKRKGTARLTVKVPGAGDLALANTTKVKGAKKRAEAKGKQKLPVRAKGETKKTLNRKGKAKVKAEVIYTPTGRDPTVVANTDTKTVKLVKG